MLNESENELETFGSGLSLRSRLTCFPCCPLYSNSRPPRENSKPLSVSGIPTFALIESI